MAKKTGRTWPHLLLVAALLLAGLLALGQFGQSLWRDEASSVWFARLPVDTLKRALCDPHPAGYYLLLKAWLAGGESEFWLRLPSLFAALLAVALTYRLGRELGGAGSALPAALLVAWHPLQVWYAAEVRMYLPLQCAGLLLAWLGWRLMDRERPAGWGRWVVYGLALIAALGLDSTALLPIALLQFLWLVRGRPFAWRWLGMQVVPLVMAAGLWFNPTQWLALAQGYPPVFIAVQAARLGFDLSPAAAGRLAVTIASLLALAGLGLAWAWPGRLRAWLGGATGRWLAVAGWAALLLLAAVPRGYTVKRLLVVLLPYLAVLAAYHLARLPRPAALLAVSAGLAVSLLILPGHQREPWRSIVAQLSQAASSGGVVIWVDDLAVPVFDYYARTYQGETGPLPWAPLSGRVRPALAPAAGQALWLVTLDSIYRPLAAVLPPGFYQEYRLSRAYQWAGISLYYYDRQPGPAVVPAELAVPGPQAGWPLPSPLGSCRPGSNQGSP